MADATARAIRRIAERVDPSVPMVTGAEVTARRGRRRRTDGADAPPSRAQQCLVQEVRRKLRGLLQRAHVGSARERADPAASVRRSSADAGEPSSRVHANGSSSSAERGDRSRTAGAAPSRRPPRAAADSAAAARQFRGQRDPAQAPRVHRRGAASWMRRREARAAESWTRFIARLEGGACTRGRMSAPRRNRLEAHDSAAASTTATTPARLPRWRGSGARGGARGGREAERRRRRDPRAPSGASVKAPRGRERRRPGADDAVSDEADQLIRLGAGIAHARRRRRRPSRGSRPASSRPGPSRFASRFSATERRWRARAAEASSADCPRPAPGRSPGGSATRPSEGRDRVARGTRPARPPPYGTSRGRAGAFVESVVPADRPTPADLRRPRRHYTTVVHSELRHERDARNARRCEKNGHRARRIRSRRRRDGRAEQRRVPSLNRMSLRGADSIVPSTDDVGTDVSGHEPAVAAVRWRFRVGNRHVRQFEFRGRPDDAPGGSERGDAAREPRCSSSARRDALPEGEDEGTDGGLPRVDVAGRSRRNSPSAGLSLRRRARSRAPRRLTAAFGRARDARGVRRRRGRRSASTRRNTSRGRSTPPRGRDLPSVSGETKNKALLPGSIHGPSARRDSGASAWGPPPRPVEDQVEAERF